MSRVLKNIANDVIRGFGNGHSGIDLGWKDDPNEPVTAHSEGTVTFLQTGYGNNQGSSGNASYGNCVKLSHPNGYATLYAHLEKVFVTDGQWVERGQVIGLMGNTGNSYGNHLHFEVHNADGVKIDPAPYIDADLPGLSTEVPVSYSVRILESDGQNVRDRPDGAILRLLPKGTVVPITAELGGWGKLSDGGWIYLALTEKIEEDDDMLTYEQFTEYMRRYEKEVAAIPESDWSKLEGGWKKACDQKVFDGSAPRSPLSREQAAAVFSRMGLLK